MRWPARHHLGDPVLRLPARGTVPLGCGCGGWGCWSFAADVEVHAGTVTWTAYRDAVHDRDHRELRGRTFRRSPYEHAVPATAARAR